jgi:predicted amidohydrolase
MKDIKISLIQPMVHKNNEINFSNMETLIENACQQNPQIICLPERWYFVDPLANNQISLEGCLQPERSSQYNYVKQWAKEYNISIISGAMWEKEKSGRNNFINAYFFDKNGQEKFQQRKIHLYSLEKQGFQAGNELICFQDDNSRVKFCILICFDLNISSNLTKLAVINGCEIIFSPTLIRSDGAENWKIYLQARALENRVPVASCNSIFNYFNRRFNGQSKIVHFKKGSSSPAKLLIQEATEKQEILTKTVNLSFPNKIRKERIQEEFGPSEITVKNIG